MRRFLEVRKGGTHMHLGHSPKSPRATRAAPRRTAALWPLSNTKHRVPDSQKYRTAPSFAWYMAGSKGRYLHPSPTWKSRCGIGSSPTQVELTLQGRSALARSCNVPFQLHGICVLWYGTGAGYPEQKAYSCWQHIKDDC